MRLLQSVIQKECIEIGLITKKDIFENISIYKCIVGCWSYKSFFSRGLYMLKYLILFIFSKLDRNKFKFGKHPPIEGEHLSVGLA